MLSSIVVTGSWLRITSVERLRSRPVLRREVSAPQQRNTQGLEVAGQHVVDEGEGRDRRLRLVRDLKTIDVLAITERQKRTEQSQSRPTAVKRGRLSFSNAVQA